MVPKKIEMSQDFARLLANIYEQMDQSYLKAASSYDFVCNGCDENCCETRFFHHTYIEFGYLLKGFNQLTQQKKDIITERAKQVCDKTQKLLKQQKSIRLMCPLNEDQRCLLYAHRPMICRLHGLAHELKMPGKPIQYTPGCDFFTKHCEGNKKEDYYTFDRTPHYINMAKLEHAFKQEYNIDQRIKLTIAEMIIAD